MPWTASEFRSRHAKHLSPSQAAYAANMANGMLKSGASEGVAIATAIKRAKAKGRHHVMDSAKHKTILD